MKSSTLLRSTRYLLAGLLCALFFGLFLSPDSQAANVTSRLPNSDDFSTGNNVYLEVSNTSPGNSLVAPTSLVKIYSQDRTISLTVGEYDHCNSGPAGHDTNYISTTYYKLQTTDSNESPAGTTKSFDDGGACRSDHSKTVTISAKAGHTSGLTGHEGWYVFSFQATLAGGGVNSFKLHAPGAYIGYSKDADYRFALQDRVSDTNTKMNANLYFAPSCNVNSPQTAKLIWSNDDYNGSPQSPFIGQLDSSLYDETAGSYVDSSLKNRFVGHGQTSYSFTIKPDHKYRWHWSNVARNNGIQFKLPYDSFYYETGCPSTGWKLTPKTTVNLKKVYFPRHDVPAGPDTQPGKPSGNKPSGYSKGMDCSYYNGHPDAKGRCQDWNQYYTQLAKYNARQAAKDHNKQAARNALNRVHFTHKVGNTSKNNQGKWGTAPNGDHTSTIWYKVNAAAGSTNWDKRYGNGAPWSTSIPKDSWREHYKSPTNVPGATADNGLKPMLEDPQTGDRYCEQLRVNPSSSTGAGMVHDEKCVELAPGDECEGAAWNVIAYSTIKQTDGNGTPFTGPLGDSVNDGWVGEQYGFFYAFGNSGPADRTSNITFYSYPGLNPGDGGTVPLSVPNPFGTYLAAPVNSDAASLWWQTGRNSSRQIQATDGGRTYTFYARYAPAYGHWDPTNNPSDCDHGGAGQTPTLSVSVPWYYQLRSQVTLNNEPIVQQGTPLHVDPQAVLNSIDADRGDGDRYNTCANEFDWQLRVTAQKPDTPTVKENVPSGSEDGHKNPRDICPNGNPGSAQALSSGKSIDTTVFPSGTKLCGHLTITPSTESGGSASAEKCTTVVKAPKVQFWNSDVNAGRHFQQADNNPTCGQQLASLGDANITTSGPPTSVASNNLYGSWVEYGAFASGNLSSFGSAAQNKTGTFSVSPTGQRLTFGNDSQLGQFDYSNWCIPNYEKLYEPQRDQNIDVPDQTGSSVNLGDLNSNGYYQATQAGTVTLTNIGDIDAGKQNITINAPDADVVLQGGTVKPGVRLVIHAKGTIKINGNIRYASGGYSSIDRIPRIVVVADGQLSVADGQQGIVIKDEVTQIDAWLVTRQALYTCTTKPASFTYHGAKCGEQLTMNGPVAANAFHLRRTFGADLTKPLVDRGPAEVFNLNPDSLLGSYSAAQRDYFIDVYQRDVPPRY